MVPGRSLHRTAVTMVAAAVMLAPLVWAQQPAPPAPPGGRGGAQAPQVVSPEVMPDRLVVFRILAPQAQNVRLVGSDIPALAGGGRGAAAGTPPPGQMTKGDNGVWSVTLGPIDPGAYRYNFNVDGVSVIDPRNSAISESNTNVWSLVYVPGSDVMDTRQVPHGAVASVTYYSTALGKFRRMHVYTPPGYETGTQKYPVFYLLHGAGDCDEAWTSVGRAGFILDNLIAAKKVTPMVVVMPAGHTNTTPAGGRAAAPAPGAAPAPPSSPLDDFARDFLTDIMPYAERHYRVIADRAHRAIAGLSMGGSQTLNVAFLHLEHFAYIGVFSSGASLGGGRAAAPAAPGTAPVPPPAVAAAPTAWETSHLANLDNASLKKGTKLIWLSTGVNDGLLPNTKATVEMLKKHGFAPVFKESPGGHTWINWRNYLSEFSTLLFQ